MTTIDEIRAHLGKAKIDAAAESFVPDIIYIDYPVILEQKNNKDFNRDKIDEIWAKLINLKAKTNIKIR